MTNHQFLRGIGLGVLAGAAIGLAVTPHTKAMRGTATKAIRVVGEAAEHMADAIDL